MMQSLFETSTVPYVMPSVLPLKNYIMCINPYIYRDLTNHCREEAANLMPVRPITPTENDNKTVGRISGVGFPFTVFLDVNGDTQVVRTETMLVTIPTSCSNGQVFDPIDQICRTTICPESAHGGSCAIVQNITLSMTIPCRVMEYPFLLTIQIFNCLMTIKLCSFMMKFSIF
jgi:hypothetical protein